MKKRLTHRHLLCSLNDRGENGQPMSDPSVPVLFRRVPHIRRRHSDAELASQGRFPARGSLEAALCAHAKLTLTCVGRSSRSEYGLQSISPHIHWAFLHSTSHSISTLPVNLPLYDALLECTNASLLLAFSLLPTMIFCRLLNSGLS